MSKPLPKWLLKKFAKIWREKGGTEFDYSEAINILNESPKKTGSILSKLHKAGWVTREKSPEDKRKRIYKIRDFEDIFKKL